MTLNDSLANALSHILNSEKVGKSEVLVKPISKLMKNVFDILQKNLYLGEIEEVEDGKGNFAKVHLIGKVNNCGVIKPRFAVTKDNFEKFEKRFLPARGFGLIIISTSQGLMTLDEAKEKGIGGKLIAYCY